MYERVAKRHRSMPRPAWPTPVPTIKLILRTGWPGGVIALTFVLIIAHALWTWIHD